MFTSTKNDPAWRWAIGVVIAGRIAFSLWAFVVVRLTPLLVSNLTLFGAPVLAMFDLRTSERAVYSRVANGQELHFLHAPDALADRETATRWAMTGEAVSGTLVGTRLSASAYTAEDVYPYVGVKPGSNSLLAVWQRFDANWYLKIAARGYAPDDGSTVYLPLYPITIRVLGTVLLGNDLLASIIITNAALVGALYLLYKMAGDLIGQAGARRTLAFMLFFPTAFFLFAPYTESVFLFLALGSLRAGMRGQWGYAGVLGACAAMTRLQGVLMILPLGYLWWRNRAQSGKSLNGWSRYKSAAALLLIPTATVVFLVWEYSFVGNASLIGAYEGQLHARFVMPWDNIAAMTSLIVSGSARLVDILNLLSTLLFGLLVVAIWKTPWMPRELVIYSLIMYLAPLLRMTTLQPLVSMMRYVVVIFPVFIAWGEWGKNPWVHRAIVYLGFPLSMYLSAQYVMWGWVG